MLCTLHSLKSLFQSPTPRHPQCKTAAWDFFKGLYQPHLKCLNQKLRNKPLKIKFNTSYLIRNCLFDLSPFPPKKETAQKQSRRLLHRKTLIVYPFGSLSNLLRGGGCFICIYCFYSGQFSPLNAKQDLPILHQLSELAVLWLVKHFVKEQVRKRTKRRSDCQRKQPLQKNHIHS